LSHPLLQEFYSADTTLVINFGRVDSDNCGGDYARAFLLSCINIPLIFDCDTAEHVAFIDTVSFTLQYTCDSACTNCSDILTCGTTTTYNHPCGSSVNIPYTKDSALTIFRTDLGYVNQKLPHYYTTSCSNSPDTIASIRDTLIDKADTIINTDAGYPGDQVETTIYGGYSGLVPNDFIHEYLQIRHPVYPGSPYKGFLFELDPNIPSYFIMHGCIGVPALNGDTLILPANTPFYTDESNGSTVEMNFPIDTAIYHSFSSYYTAFKTDTLSETISVSAHIHLRIWNPDLSAANTGIISPLGEHVINLRNEYMAVQKPGTYSADSLHSSDNWGTRFSILQPNSSAVNIAATSPSSCAAFQVDASFQQGGTYLLPQDFPNEFRPLFELDNTETITLPAGYVYDSTSFYTYFDNYTTSRDSNYFRNGIADRQYLPMTPASLVVNAQHQTILTYNGLNNSCWPLVDQKAPNQSEVQGYYVKIYTSPLCNVASPATFYRTAGFRMYTQQPDTNFQIHILPRLDSVKVTHANPIVNIGIPPLVTDYSNLISFKFTLCDSGFAASNGWVAFENPAPDTLNMLTATLTNLHTHQVYYSNLFDANNGVFFNLKSIAVGTCDTLLFSAYIDSNSHSCPAPRDSGNGTVRVKYGNTCNDTLSDPNALACENDSVFFDYHIYANDLELTNSAHRSDTVSLCGGLLVDSLTITSADLGTISDPEFWGRSSCWRDFR